MCLCFDLFLCVRLCVTTAQVLCATAERDLVALRMIAESFAPYLREKEAEMRPKTATKPTTRYTRVRA